MPEYRIPIVSMVIGCVGPLYFERITFNRIIVVGASRYGRQYA